MEVPSSPKIQNNFAKFCKEIRNRNIILRYENINLTQNI